MKVGNRTYLLERRVGKGAAGILFIARVDGARRLVKFRRDPRLRDEIYDFQQERASLARLRAYGINAQKAYPDDSSDFVLEKEYIEGTPADRIDLKSFSPRRRLRYIRGYLALQGQLRREGMWISDFKPENLIAADRGARWVICDPGVIQAGYRADKRYFGLPNDLRVRAEAALIDVGDPGDSHAKSDFDPVLATRYIASSQWPDTEIKKFLLQTVRWENLGEAQREACAKVLTEVKVAPGPWSNETRDLVRSVLAHPLSGKADALMLMALTELPPADLKGLLNLPQWQGHPELEKQPVVHVLRKLDLEARDIHAKYRICVWQKLTVK